MLRGRVGEGGQWATRDMTGSDDAARERRRCGTRDIACNEAPARDSLREPCRWVAVGPGSPVHGAGVFEVGRRAMGEGLGPFAPVRGEAGLEVGEREG